MQLGFNSSDGITANDVFNANLNSILSLLLFTSGDNKEAISAQHQLPVQQQQQKYSQHPIRAKHNPIHLTSQKSAITSSSAMLSKLPFGNSNKTNAKTSCSSIPVGPKMSNGGAGIPSIVSPSIVKCASTQGSPRSGSPSSQSFIPHPGQAATAQPTAYVGTQSANQTATTLPTKGTHTHRPASTSAIPYASAKSGVILRNRTNACNQQQCQQTIVDKIKQYNKSRQQISNSDPNSHQIVVNSRESTVSKRTSGSSGFSSAKSDSSASLCGLETTSASTVSKIKPTVTQSVSKTRTNNYNTVVSQPSANTNTNTLSNPNICVHLSNSITKRGEEVVNNCDNRVNSNYRSANTCAKLGSIPVKRIQPPRSRPTSTVFDNNPIPSTTMASNCHSVSNSSLVTIAKPTATVKGTTKVFASEESANRLSNSRLKFDNQCSTVEQLSQTNTKMKSSADKCPQQQQPVLSQKSEPSIAMVSPIMARDENKGKHKSEAIDSGNGVKEFSNQMIGQKIAKQRNEDNLKSDDKLQERTVGKKLSSDSSSPIVLSEQGDGGEEESASNSDVESALVNIKPMAPLVRTSQFAFLRGNENPYPNGTVFNRYPNNYSSIENGYLSECTLNESTPRPHNYKSCHSTAGYMSGSDVCSPQMKRNQIISSKPDYLSPTHRHYNDTDSAANNTNVTQAANLFHLMHPKPSTSSNAQTFSTFCLDDSSSLSSDAGMISGTEASGTTTTSSMSSSTGADPISHYMSKSKNTSAKSSSKCKSSAKKTDSSMQTESMSAISSTAVWKRYLHEHHLMMKANTIAPKANSAANGDEGTKSLDRLETRPNTVANNKKLSQNSKIIERHDSFESIKGGINNKNNLKHDLSLLSNNKRPLSSPSGSRTAVTTTPGPVLKQYSVQRQSHKSKQMSSMSSQQTDSVHSDSEYIQQKQQNSNNFQHLMANKYPFMTSPVRQRDVSSRLSSYADIGGYGAGGDGQSTLGHTSMSPWLQRHALALQRNAMTEAESMESLNGPLSLDSSYFLTRQHCSPSRSNSTAIRFRETSSASPGFSSTQSRSKDQLIRNGSIRLNKTSEPTSPTRFANHVYISANNDQSITTTAGIRSVATNGQMSQLGAKEEIINGSSLSLVSTSSMFSSSEDKHNQEVRKLRRELDQANDKVNTLTSQLTTNAHMVAAFEQSLSSMTARLQQLSASAELKDTELDRLRNTIETLRKQSTGVVDHSLSSSKANTGTSNTSANRVKTASLIRRHTFSNTSAKDGKGDPDYNSRIARQLSAESVSSVSSGADGSVANMKSKKKSKTAKILNNSSSGWLRSSFNKAFKKNKSFVKRDALSDVEAIGNGSGNEGDSSSVPNSPLMACRPFRSNSDANPNDLNHGSDVVQDLNRQLREKEMALTDLRLESLTSAHQLENLKETVNQLRAEMLNLRQDNDRLNRLVSSKSLASSQSSMTSGICGQNSHNGSTFTGRPNGQVAENDGNSIESLEMEAVTNALLCDGGKLVTVGSGTHIIASLVVTPKTNWDQLDLMIKKAFKEHINRIDVTSGLSLSLDALACYQVGTEKIQRQIVANKSIAQSSHPELLPFGYLVNENHIYLQFKSASDSLVFDTLTPKSIIQRYIGLLNEHRRIILCGPSGTGKTFLAHKLAEYLAIKRATEGRSPGTPLECCPVGAIATFSVDHKSAKELRAYLSKVAEQCESESLSQHLPTVIILDNLHHVSDISEVFNGLLHITHTKCPYIIGTMNQTTCTTTNLQLNHNFRWVLLTNHMEPVKGFLARLLRRKLIETEVKMASNGSLSTSAELNRIIDWIPKLWNHLNRFLESHSSSDVTIGPRLFSSCPIDVNGSQVWFTDLWNYSIIPYIVEATREGIQMYGKRHPFVDPTNWVFETYPWPNSPEWVQHLLRIRPEDVNYECDKQNTVNGNECLAPNSSDPLLNMLMRLQEAANYPNSSQPNQSYNNNNDNNNHHNHNSTHTSAPVVVNSGLESNL